MTSVLIIILGLCTYTQSGKLNQHLFLYSKVSLSYNVNLFYSHFENLVGKKIQKLPLIMCIV